MFRLIFTVDRKFFAIGLHHDLMVSFKTFSVKNKRNRSLTVCVEWQKKMCCAITWAVKNGIHQAVRYLTLTMCGDWRVFASINSSLAKKTSEFYLRCKFQGNLWYSYCSENYFLVRYTKWVFFSSEIYNSWIIWNPWIIVNEVAHLTHRWRHAIMFSSNSTNAIP